MAAAASPGVLTLHVGNKRYSSWSLRPWLFLNHHRIPFTEVSYKLDTPDMARLVGVSPTLRVPVLEVQEAAGGGAKHTVWDSLAILEWAAETYPHTHGWPTDPWRRAEARCVAAEMHSGLGGIRSALPFNAARQGRPRVSPLSANTLSDIQRVKEIFTSCRQRFGAVGPWLFGQLTIADCMFAPVALRLAQYAIPLADAPLAAEYVATVGAHPAVKEWLAAGAAEQDVIDCEEVD